MWKIGLALILLAAAAGTGYYYGSGQVIIEKGETQIVVHDRIVTHTIVRQPDGTTTEVTKEEEINHQTETTQVSHTPSPQAQGNYRIGASYWAGSITDVLEPSNRYNGIGLSASRRIAGPIWLGLDTRVLGSKKEVALGVSVQW